MIKLSSIALLTGLAKNPSPAITKNKLGLLATNLLPISTNISGRFSSDNLAIKEITVLSCGT